MKEISIPKLLSLYTFRKAGTESKIQYMVEDLIRSGTQDCGNELLEDITESPESYPNYTLIDLEIFISKLFE